MTASQIINLKAIIAGSVERGLQSSHGDKHAVRSLMQTVNTPVSPRTSACQTATPKPPAATPGVSPIVELKDVPCERNQPANADRLSVALRDAVRASGFERLTFAFLAAGSVISVAAALAQTGRLLAGWSTFVRLIESVLS